MRRKRCHRIGLTKTQMIEGITNGTIASGVSDTGATSTAGKPGDPFATSKKNPPRLFVCPQAEPPPLPTKPSSYFQ